MSTNNTSIFAGTLLIIMCLIAAITVLFILIRLILTDQDLNKKEKYRNITAVIIIVSFLALLAACIVAVRVFNITQLR